MIWFHWTHTLFMSIVSPVKFVKIKFIIFGGFDERKKKNSIK